MSSIALALFALIVMQLPSITKPSELSVDSELADELGSLPRSLLTSSMLCSTKRASRPAKSLQLLPFLKALRFFPDKLIMQTCFLVRTIEEEKEGKNKESFVQDKEMKVDMRLLGFVSLVFLSAP